MGDIQIRLDLKKLERFVYLVAIVVLISMLVWPGFRDKTVDFFDLGDAKITGAVVGVKEDKPTTTQTQVEETSAPKQEEKKESTATTTTAEKDEPTCNDGKKNQDETNVDCGGVCGGFWYDNKCNPGPKRPTKKECEENEDCNEGYLCEDNKCVESPYSGDVTLQLSSIKYSIDEKDEEKEEDDTAKVTSFYITVKNDREEDIRSPRVEVYIWDAQNAETYEYNIRQANIPLGTIKTGETFKDTISDSDPYFLVTIPFGNLNLTKSMKVLLYDYKNNLLDNVTEDFEPK